MTSNPPKANVIYGYARVSTEEQSLQLQLDELHKHGVDNIVLEKDGGSKDRPKLKKLIASLQEGDTLVVWRLDRLCRNAAELLKLAEDFYKLGVHLVCLKEGFDISTASGRLVFSQSSHNMNVKASSREPKPVLKLLVITVSVSVGPL